MFPKEDVSQTTEALEKLPRVFDRRNAVTERRQQILQHKQTDTLPALSAEGSTPAAKAAMRQVIQLREDNRRLRVELEESHQKLQVADGKNAQWQQKFEAEVAAIHNGHQHELAHFQDHLQEAISERNQLHVQYTQLQQQHQELAENFTQAVDIATQRRMSGLAQEAKADPAKTSPLLLELRQSLLSQDEQDIDRSLSETRLLKREAQRMMAALEKERQQLQMERQQLAALQSSIREQSVFRMQTLERRLYARWRVASVGIALGLLVLLVILQLICLSLLHFASATLAILAPIVICIVLAFVLGNPLKVVRHIYVSMPHRERKR